LREDKMAEGIVDFKEWEKIDLRVGEILEVEDIEEADKLYRLTVDLGAEIGMRTVCAGIKKYYGKEELLGKKIILFVNLAPRLLKGIESQGMLLAAVNIDEETGEEKVVLLAPEGDIEAGSKVR
jgi:methionyl-tRNA synthetase